MLAVMMHTLSGPMRFRWLLVLPCVLLGCTGGHSTAAEMAATYTGAIDTTAITLTLE